MNGLFINYRREDSAPYAGRLYDFLRHAFPDRKVFMDIDAIDPGEDFVNAITKTLESSKVVIAVIGPNWLKATDRNGSRRLDNLDDYVYRELSAALGSDARVIPVLVGGAEMPRSDSLPPGLQLLARRNAIEISDTRFTTDSERLGEAIAKALDTEMSRGEGSRTGRKGGATDAADSMTTFKTILWTSYALGLVAMFLQIDKAEPGSGAGVVVFGVLYFGLAAWFNVMLTRGKNWARMANLALGVLSIPGLFATLGSLSSTEVVINVIGVVLWGWVLWLMFTDPLKRIFMKR